MVVVRPPAVCTRPRPPLLGLFATGTVGVTWRAKAVISRPTNHNDVPNRSRPLAVEQVEGASSRAQSSSPPRRSRSRVDTRPPSNPSAPAAARVRLSCEPERPAKQQRFLGQGHRSLSCLLSVVSGRKQLAMEAISQAPLRYDSRTEQTISVTPWRIGYTAFQPISHQRARRATRHREPVTAGCITVLTTYSPI
jgi:hypothetical protein